jgi:hypothetical protein
MKLWTAVRFIALAMTAGVFVTASACGTVGGIIGGSGTTVSKQFDLQGFTRIDASSAFDVTIERADTYGVSVSYDDNLAQYLKVELHGQTLRIGLQEGNVYSDTHLKASVTLPALDAISMSGASSARAGGFQSGRTLALDLSGASSVSLNDLKAGALKVDLSGAAHVTGSIVATEAAFGLSGASKVTLSGSAPTVSIDASGGATADLLDFAADRVKASLSGGADAKVKVTASLDASLSGGSDLQYVGDPTLGDVQTSGGSQVHRGG